MAQLTDEHIAYIIKDLDYRGIVLDGFREEVTDHFCAAVEAEMEAGKRFIDAHTSGLRNTQHQVLQSENKTAHIMLRNYFVIAFRNLTKHRFYTFINVLGLAIGIASCLLITIFIMYELSFDSHFTNAERIYRLDSEMNFNGNQMVLAAAPAPAAATVLRDFPEVEATASFRQWGWRRIRRPNNAVNIKEQYTVYGSNGIFKTFSLSLLNGNGTSALTEPNTVVISQSKATQYFHGEDPFGQTLIIDGKDSYKVTGVFEDFPSSTHFKFDFIFSMEGLEESKANDWLSSNFNTYVLLKPGANPRNLERKFPKMVETYFGKQIKMFFGKDFSMRNSKGNGNKIEFLLTPLLSIHLYSDKTSELSANSDITYIYLFGAVALFILAIACINFMNLSTARSANRAKEVGIRKVLGSLRSHLVRQFLMESIQLSMASLLIALTIVYLTLPEFNILAERNLTIPLNPLFIAVLLLATLVIGCLAGIYPALFLSAFKPVNVLKGDIALGMKSGAVRSSLVIFQFMISIFLIIATVTVKKQMDFIQSKKLGYQKDQVVVLHNTELLEGQSEAFKNELLSIPEITNVSATGYLPIAGWTGRSDRSFWPYGIQPSQDNLVTMQNWLVDIDYIKTMGMEIVKGRNFSREYPSDSTAIIINESAAQRYGFKDPIGEKVSTFKGFSADYSNTVTYTVIGVVHDFHFESLKQNITPLGIHLGKSGWAMPVRFASSNTAAVIENIGKTWNKFEAGQPFEYTFLDDAFGKMYSAEKRLERLFGIFSALAIMIACLGLFGLTSFTAEQRTREIGIRKILGATDTSIVYLLSKEFGKLILISFVLAAPLAWYAVNRWLENYSYKTEVGIAVYLIAGVAAFVVALFTMGFQSIKAARSNPVVSLRSE